MGQDAVHLTREDSSHQFRISAASELNCDLELLSKKREPRGLGQVSDTYVCSD